MKFDQNLPVLVTTGFDNGTSYSSNIGVHISRAHPGGEGTIWDRSIWELNNTSDSGDEWPGEISAVVISGSES